MAEGLLVKPAELAPEEFVLEDLVYYVEPMLVELLDDDVGRPTLDVCYRTHESTYWHQVRTATMLYAICRDAGVPEVMCQKAAVGALFHDVGKYDDQCLPLVDVADTLTTEQWKIMNMHAALGSAALGRMQLKASGKRNAQAASRYWFAGGMAGDHHNHKMDYPDSEHPTIQWMNSATRVLQVVDIVDAVTSERPYLKRRMAQEGVRDPVVIITDVLQADYGDRQDEPLPVLGLSPRVVAYMALQTKLDFCIRQLEGSIASLPPDEITSKLVAELEERRRQRLAANALLAPSSAAAESY